MSSPLISFFNKPPKNRCDALQGDHIYVNLAVSLFILLGILVSYLPQHYRIISRRTSAGISPYFVLLGTISGTSSFANILTLPASRADVACCKVVSGFECFAGLLGIAQVGVQWSCFTVILLLFLVFFPRDPTPPFTLDNTEEFDSTQPQWRTALLVAGICLLHAVVILITTLALAFASPNSLGPWANLLGIMAAGLAAVQYFPQIWTTYHLGHVGSLSIPMMVIQTPGGFVWAGSLAARLGMEGWSTWGVFVITGCLQGCLLTMGIIFEIRDRAAKDVAGDIVADVATRLPHDETGSDEQDEDVTQNGHGHNSERTPLLESSNSKKSSRR